jgi:hypothetical protein
MQMRTVLALVLVCVVSVVPLRAEDPHPDFTGSWIVESVASAGGDRERPEGRRGGGGFGRGGGLGRRGRGGDGRGDGVARGPVPDEPRLERPTRENAP